VIPPEQVAERYLYIELDVEHPDYADQKNFGYALSMIVKNEKLGERPFFDRVELLPSDPIRGTILSPDGAPLAGIKLLGYSKANASDFRDYGSFTRAVTGADGKFLLKLVKGGVGVFWVTPRDFAITSRPVGKDRGDVGEIRLQTGIRETGRLLAIDGKPLANIPVNIGYQTGGTEDLNGLPVASAIRRGVLTDAEGRFTFDPLPEGEYQLTVDEYLHDPLLEGRHRQFDVPGVFVPKKVHVKDGVVPEPIQFQESPYVMFNAQIYDSKGEKTRGHEIMLYGQIDGQWWHNYGKPDVGGTIAMKVPHGLEQVRVDLMTNEHGALRYRRAKGKELENRVRGIDFGTLTDDVEGFEIVRYRAPIVLVSAVDEAGQPIKEFKVGAAYGWGKQDYILEGEVRSDLSFEHQNDGRYRTSQMLPDEKVKFTVTAKGYESTAEEVSLSEGESKELVLTMKKVPEAEE
jgi:hypothetical protein